MSTVKFVPKPGKPHIKIIVKKYKFGGSDGYYLFPHPTVGDQQIENHFRAVHYCLDVNEGKYSTPGEAARALFNYRGKYK